LRISDVVGQQDVRLELAPADALDRRPPADLVVHDLAVEHWIPNAVALLVPVRWWRKLGIIGVATTREQAEEPVPLGVAERSPLASRVLRERIADE
jgi:hypothetical protein